MYIPIPCIQVSKTWGTKIRFKEFVSSLKRKERKKIEKGKKNLRVLIIQSGSKSGSVI